MKKIASVLALLSLFLNACHIQSLSCTAIKGFKLDQLNKDGLAGDLLVTVKNPNAFGFTLHRSSFNVTYGGVKLGQASLKKSVHIKGKSEDVYGFHIATDFTDIGLTEVMKLLTGGTRKNQIEINGKLYAGKFGLRKGFAVDLKDYIRLN